LEVSLRIEAGGSHVPHQSLRWAHAVSMPVAARAVGRHPPSFFPGQWPEPGFGDVPELSTPLQRFTRVRLPSAHLSGLTPALWPGRSPPRPLCRSSSRWFGPWPCSPSPGGLPPSLVQHGRFSRPSGLLSAPSWRTVIGSIPIVGSNEISRL